MNRNHGARRIRAELLAVAIVLSVFRSASAQVAETSLPIGANHAAAHQDGASGAGVPIAVLDLIKFRDNEETGGQMTAGIMPTIPGANPGDPPVIENLLGARLKTQYDFSNSLPMGDLNNNARVPGDFMPNATNWDPHATLSAHAAAGIANNVPPSFVGVAKGSDVFFGGSSQFTFPEFQNTFDYLNRVRDVKIFNLSLGFGGPNLQNPGAGDSAGTNPFALFSDWFISKRDALIVKSAGNNGVVAAADPKKDDGQARDGTNRISIPGDFFNGITVGSTNELQNRRAEYSSYWLGTDNGSLQDVRGKPDIVAPGSGILDGKSYPGPVSGTSFAAPLVTGTAALVSEEIGSQQLGGTQHLAIKANILNSARKQSIVGANSANDVAVDHTTSSLQTSDALYLKVAPGGQLLPELFQGSTVNNPERRSETWTPSDWSYDGSVFKTLVPLDDELGTGVLDAHRAVLQTKAGEHAPGNVPVAGWHRGSVSANDPFAQYALDGEIKEGTFLTATLLWDRIITETNDPNDMDAVLGQVDVGDTYQANTLADLNLNIYFQNTLIAQSVSTLENVEHLHIPLMADGEAGDYTIEARRKSGPPTPYAIAWNTRAVPEPSALGLLAVAIAMLALRRGRRARSC